MCYERISESIYKTISTPKDQLSNGYITAINLLSGLGAGTVAAIVSQPADTLLSKINKQKAVGNEGIMKRLVNLAAELGPAKLFIGLGPRIVMVGTLTAGQFAIYGDIKRALGATNSIEIAKVGSSSH